MLAEYASRMRLKNRIIIGVITQDAPYDAESYQIDAAAVVDALANESERVAERLTRECDIIEGQQGSAAHAHDYRRADLVNLRLRADVAQALAVTLRSRRDDPEFLLTLIESARGDAWSDIARAIEESLDRSSIPVDETYKRERAKRMRLVAEDLTELLITPDY